MLRYLRALISVGLVWSAYAVGQPAAAAPGPPDDLTVVVFPGVASWPLWVMQDRGMDVRNGIRVELVETRDSVDQIGGLATGRYDLAITAFDNVVAYSEGQGSSAVGRVPVVAVMGGDSGNLALVARPEFKSVGDLKGQGFAVDALSTGFAFALREALSRAGLDAEDYTLTSVGGTHLRYEALVAGRTTATLLMPPFTALATQQGLNRLLNVSRELDPYQGAVAAARSDWAAQHPDRVTAYITAYREALAWLYDPANRAQALAIYRQHSLLSTPEAGEATYKALIDPANGFQPEGDFDVLGMQTVLALRVRHGPPGATVGPVTRYYDTHYLEAAKIQGRATADPVSEVAPVN